MVKIALVTDNNQDITGFIKQGLEYSHPAEYNIICVDSGKKCLELLEKNCCIPEVTLLELKMPDMNE